MIFLNENLTKNKNSNNIWQKNRLSKYDYATIRWTVIHRQDLFIYFIFSMSILSQKYCFLGLTIFGIPQPNWFTNSVFSIICQRPILNFKSILQISVLSLKNWFFFNSTGGEEAFNLDPVISFGYLYGEAGETGERFKNLKKILKKINNIFNIFSKNFRTSALPNICHVNFPRLPCGNQYFDRLSFHRGKTKPEIRLFRLLPSQVSLIYWIIKVSLI